MSIRIERRGASYVLQTEQTLPHPRGEVFAFFADALNLQDITPRQLRLQVLTPQPITMAKGLHVDYRLRVGGLPARWTSEITVWDPPFRFVDEQRRGPYRWWIHEHEFVEDGASTVVRDRVDYAVPGGALAHGLFVRRQLMRIFAHRREVIERSFGAGSPAAVTVTSR